MTSFPKYVGIVASNQTVKAARMCTQYTSAHSMKCTYSKQNIIMRTDNGNVHAKIKAEK